MGTGCLNILGSVNMIVLVPEKQKPGFSCRIVLGAFKELRNTWQIVHKEVENKHMLQYKT